MRRQFAISRGLALAVVGLLLACAGAVSGQTTTFSYQGKLTDAGNPANASFDLQFKLFDTPTVGTGAQQGGTLVRNPVAASDGIFSVTLDFGAPVFGGADRFLEIGVRPTGSGAAYAVLSPRQPITSSPYAIQTLNAQQLGGLPANRYLASAANGDFGIGTGSPQAPLHVSGTTWFQGDSTPLPAAAGKGVAMGFSGEQGYLFAFDYGAFAPENLLLNHPGGNVGVGTASPTGGRLHVEGGSGPAVYAHSDSSVGLWGTSTQFEGVRGEANDVNHGAVVGVHNGGGIGVFGSSTGAGVQGVSTPGWGVVGTSTNNWGVVGTSTNSQGVHGESTAASSFGVYAKNLTGWALGVDGHATQNRDRGGLVKALLYVNYNGAIIRCFNSFLAGASATSGNCGFTVSHMSAGNYLIDFGFQVDDRFINLTGVTTPSSCLNPGTNVDFLTGNQVWLETTCGTVRDATFFMSVY